MGSSCGRTAFLTNPGTILLEQLFPFHRKSPLLRQLPSSPLQGSHCHELVDTSFFVDGSPKHSRILDLSRNNCLLHLCLLLILFPVMYREGENTTDVTQCFLQSAVSAAAFCWIDCPSKKQMLKWFPHCRRVARSWDLYFSMCSASGFGPETDMGLNLWASQHRSSALIFCVSMLKMAVLSMRDFIPGSVGKVRQFWSSAC